MPIEIKHGGDCIYARGHHDPIAFSNAALDAGYVVMGEIEHVWWRWGFGANEDPEQLGAWIYDSPGRGRFPVTGCQWLLRVCRKGDPSTRLGAHNYDAAMAEIKRLIALDPEPGTYDGKRLVALSELMEEYEKVYFPIGAY